MTIQGLYVYILKGDGERETLNYHISYYLDLVSTSQMPIVCVKLQTPTNFTNLH